MALTIHCVAQGLWEQGQSNSAEGVWRKARLLRKAAVIVGVVTVVIWILLLCILRE